MSLEEKDDFEWLVTRIDDYDKKWIVKKLEKKEQAEILRDYYNSLGHHQVYYVEQYE